MTDHLFTHAVFARTVASFIASKVENDHRLAPQHVNGTDLREALNLRHVTREPTTAPLSDIIEAELTVGHLFSAHCAAFLAVVSTPSASRLRRHT